MHFFLKNKLSVEELEISAGGWMGDELKKVFSEAGDGFTGNERQ